MNLKDKRSFIMNIKTGKRLSDKKMRDKKFLKKNQDNEDLMVFLHLENGIYKTITMKTLKKLKKVQQIKVTRTFSVEGYGSGDDWEPLIKTKDKIKSLENLLKYYIFDSVMINFWDEMNLYLGIPCETRHYNFTVRKNGRKKKIDHEEFNRKHFSKNDERLGFAWEKNVLNLAQIEEE